MLRLIDDPDGSEPGGDRSGILDGHCCRDLAGGGVDADDGVAGERQDRSLAGVLSPPSVRTRATVRAAIAASAASVPAMSVRRLRCAVDGGAGRATAVWTPSVSSLAVG